MEKKNLLNPNTYKECKINRYGINYKYIPTRSTPKMTYILQTLCEELICSQDIFRCVKILKTSHSFAHGMFSPQIFPLLLVPKLTLLYMSFPSLFQLLHCEGASSNFHCPSKLSCHMLAYMLSIHNISTIGMKTLASEEGRIIRGKKYIRGCNIIWFTRPAHWSLLTKRS
jgi:hypothetical protein